MTHDEMIAVIKAHRDGKSIQSRSRNSTDDSWYLCERTPTWNFGAYDYRVKPEKQVMYVNVYEGSDCFSYKSREESDRQAWEKKRIACVRIEYTPGQFDD